MKKATPEQTSRVLAIYGKIESGKVRVPKGTDVHSYIAKEVGIDRQVVKVILFGIYPKENSFMQSFAGGLGRGLPEMFRSAMEGEDRRRIVDALELIALATFGSNPDAVEATTLRLVDERSNELAKRIASRPLTTGATTVSPYEVLTETPDPEPAPKPHAGTYQSRSRDLREALYEQLALRGLSSVEWHYPGAESTTQLLENLFKRGLVEKITTSRGPGYRRSPDGDAALGVER